MVIKLDTASVILPSNGHSDLTHAFLCSLEKWRLRLFASRQKGPAMHFKPSRPLIATLVGSCILLVVAILLLYSLMTHMRSQALVESESQPLLKQNVEPA
ncbi:hypothetical protein [Vreelandella sp. EE22]